MYIQLNTMKTNFLFWTAVVAVLATASCNNSDEVLAVRLDQNKLELVKGESKQLNARVVPDQDVEFTWYSENAECVKVDENGVVTALAVNRDKESGDILPVSVYVKYLNGADQCQVTVTPLAPTKLDIVCDKNVLEIKPGAEASVVLDVKFYPEDADLRDLEWTTDNASVAKVDKTGRVTGIGQGFANIRATYNDKIYDDISVRVLPVNPESVRIEPAELSLEVGQKSRLKIVFNPSNASGDARWTSDNADVVTVDPVTGAIEAKSVGTANVKVQVGTCTSLCNVTVK